MAEQTIITSVFETKRGNYEELLRVFLYSAKKHMPNANVIVVRDIPERRGRSNTYNAMTSRLDSWVPVVRKLKGHHIILCDVDLIFRGDLFEVFAKHKFDVAYTARKSKRKPINGGVVFIRGDRGRKFVRMWAKVNRNMHKNKTLHRKWRRVCVGMNQPAFMYLLKHPKKHKCKMKKLSCLQWNACEPEWSKMKTDEVKVIHLKRDLRHAARGKKVRMSKGAKRAIAFWREYEEASRVEDKSCEKS